MSRAAKGQVHHRRSPCCNAQLVAPPNPLIYRREKDPTWRRWRCQKCRKTYRERVR